MTASYLDRPDGIVVYCFLTALRQLDGKTFQNVVERSKQLLSGYKDSFTERGFNTIIKDIERLSMTDNENVSETATEEERVSKKTFS